VSLRLTIDVREIYRRLCNECKRKVVQYVKEKMDEAIIEQMLLSQGEAKGEEGGG